MNKGLQAFFACCAVVITCASVLAAAVSLTALAGRSGSVVADAWSPARSKIVEELVRTRVEVGRGLNMASFHAHLVDIETDTTVARLAHSLSDTDFQILDTFISKFVAADELWRLSIDPDGPCRLGSDYSREFITNSSGCLLQATPLIAKIGEPAGYLETAAAGNVLKSQDVRQPALNGIGKSIDVTLAALANRVASSN